MFDNSGAAEGMKFLTVVGFLCLGTIVRAAESAIANVQKDNARLMRLS